MEAHYQPHVVVSMGLSELLTAGSRTRLFAKRRHCDKTEQELRELLVKEDPDGLSEPGPSRSPFLGGRPRRGLQLELSLAPTVDDLEALAMLVFPSKSGARVEARRLEFGREERSKEAHYFLKALCDVWSLRRPDGRVEKSEAIARVFSDLRARAETCNVIRSFLQGGGEARQEYAAGFQSERQCSSCGRVFRITNEREYRRYQYHCKTHYYRDHPCDCPGLKFETARAKMAHVQLVHKTGFSKCPLCPHVSKERFLLRHMETVHGPGAAPCPHCGLQGIGSAEALLAHVRSEHLEEMRRAEHAVDLDARKVFGGRKPDKRGPRPEEPSACDQCGRVYKNCSSLYKHMYSHSRFACKLCGFATSALVKYREHMRVDHQKPLHYQPNARRYLW